MDYLEALKKCSRCGGCQAHCPLYTETGREAYVVRGKIELLENLLAGKLEWNERLSDIFSACLLCGSCTENCPNGVMGDKLIRSARKDLVLVKGVPIVKKNIFQHLLTNNGRLNAVGKLIALYQVSGLQKLVRGTGLLKLLPGQLNKMESLLPKFSGRSFRNQVPRINNVENSKIRAAYFTGCVTNFVNHQVGSSVLEILKRNNVELIIPEQYCCGVPAVASGDMETGRILAERNINIFTELDVDYIITDCASCLSTFLEYPELYENEKAQKLIPKLIDINRFLVEVLDIKLNPKGLGKKVTYHDPCHLKRIEGGKESPRELLKRLSPAYEFVEMKAADKCCGSAGSFNLTHYDLSQKVAKNKVDSVSECGALVVATACPSCMMQLEHSIAKRTNSITVKHVVELVAESLRSEMNS
ncbi:MAG: hypothetical protein JM58_01250 [Peptococcaceae bacterium BICA1-8]|nr:MAG: hypothetical protein JM58_01250 [Peptococcaceae bacterium BICA1-8]